MIRHGVAPFIECSSKGDTRFSSSYATIGKKTISELYNNKRAWADESKLLTWNKAGIAPKEIDFECNKYYRELWKQYLSEHKELKKILLKATGVSNVYGEMMNVCQATVLWSIRKELLENVEPEVFEVAEHPASEQIQENENKIGLEEVVQEEFNIEED